MSEMQDIIIQSAEKIFKRHTTKELVDELEEGKFDEKTWKLLVDNGLTTIGVPESLGGVGGDLQNAFQVIKLSGKYTLPVPLAETILANLMLSRIEVQVDTTLRSIHFNESDGLNLESDKEQFLMNGQLNNVTWGRFLEELIVVTKYNHKDYVVKVSPQQSKIEKRQNLAGEPMDDLEFRNVQINPENITEINRESFIKNLMDLGGVTKVSQMCGASEEILNLCLFLTNERKQFGRPLNRLQIIQQYLATLAGDTVNITTNFDYVVDALEKHQMTYEVANSKIITNTAIRRIAETAHQIHGAVGVTHEHKLHQLTRRLWSWREEFGNEQFWTQLFAEKLMDEPNELSLWKKINNQKEELVNT